MYIHLQLMHIFIVAVFIRLSTEEYKFEIYMLRLTTERFAALNCFNKNPDYHYSPSVHYGATLIQTFPLCAVCTAGKLLWMRTSALNAKHVNESTLSK